LGEKNAFLLKGSGERFDLFLAEGEGGGRAGWEKGGELILPGSKDTALFRSVFPSYRNEGEYGRGVKIYGVDRA